jgi:hypothetical protein
LLKQGKPTASPSDQKLEDWERVKTVSVAPDDNYTIDYFYVIINGTHAAGKVHVSNCAEKTPHCSSDDAQISTQQDKTTEATGGFGDSSGAPPNHPEESPTGEGRAEAMDSDSSSEDDSDVGYHSPTPNVRGRGKCVS